MSPALHHECTRIPVTALASCGLFLVAAEGPFLRFYNARDWRYISSKRVFKAQAVHGISEYSGECDHVTKFLVWGGRLVRALEVDSTAPDQHHGLLNIRLSNIGTASDWILDLAPRPTSLEDKPGHQKVTCAAVTAHNALLQVTVGREKRYTDINIYGPALLLTISILEVTSSSRSILYSAHLVWASSNQVFVAAGTAFGEIMYWSWSHEPHKAPVSCIHRVFLGHEGSIFGVQISKELSSGCYPKLRRVIASCSDDRTIRIWDVSDVHTHAIIPEDPDNDLETSRVHHTGFSNEAFDARSFASSDCLATGWGHGSRIWTVRFFDQASCNGPLLLLSTGEDATSRTWELVLNHQDNADFPYRLLHLDCAAHHNGKNIWSSAVCIDSVGQQHVVCGAADSKITAYPLIQTLRNADARTETDITNFTIHDALSLGKAAKAVNDVTLQAKHKSSKKADFFRSYCFIDEATFLLTTNSGKVIVRSLVSGPAFEQSSSLSDLIFFTQLEDLIGYSVCASGSSPGVAFVAGAKGSIYMYRKNAATLTKIHSVNGKIGGVLAAKFPTSSGRDTVALLVTLVGQEKAQLLYVDIVHHSSVSHVVIVPTSDCLTGGHITSMAHVRTANSHYLLLGFRRGSVAVYRLCEDDSGKVQPTMFRFIERLHGDETVTCLAWSASSAGPSLGHLLSVGRDGCLAVHYVDLSANVVQLVHNLVLPIGPNIEGLYFSEKHLYVHGFSSKKWVLYDVIAEEEIMGIKTGGAHRSWIFQPWSSSPGGILVWTRASSMHICSQRASNSTVVRSGGHGREIKAVAALPNSKQTSLGCLIATGAEDTDIKLFRYPDGDLACQMTLRKHTTGIQHLQWSEDGDYLFSSGGCEELYIWRICKAPSFLGIGAVCEHVYAPESEHADLRIMSFDVTRRHDGIYIIAMVFSDSSLKVYGYAPHAAVKWRPLARGTYFTSCLTQCIFLSSDRVLTAGTDGYAVVWPLLPGMSQPIADPTSAASALSWQDPAKIHQSSSKAMTSYDLGEDTVLIVSGGDDGSLAFLLASTTSERSSSSQASSYASPPITINRAHASAVTACAIITHQSRVFVLTSGNDEWIRLWEVVAQASGSRISGKEVTGMEDRLVVTRHRKIKTSVADVSSMAVLELGEGSLYARVLLCGVGMEVIRVQWDAD